MSRLDDIMRKVDGRMEEIDRRIFGVTGEQEGAPPAGVGGAPSPQRAPEGRSKGVGMCRRIGLCVGLDRVDNTVYHGNAAPLQGCVTDATDFHNILQGAGFESRLLRDEEASRARVVDEILEASRKLVEGDLFVMAISGHGSRGNLPNDPDPHEFWCLWDGMLPDTDIVDAFGRFEAGVRIVVVTDQCHSGGVFLPPGSPEKAVAIPPPLPGRALPPLSLKGGARRFHSGAVPPMLIQLAACRGHQTSLDSEIGGRWITALIKCLAVSRDIGWREWFDRASSHGTVGQVSHKQTPQWVELGPVTDEFRHGRILV